MTQFTLTLLLIFLDAMFISEIPVRCSSSITQGEKSIRWINNLTSRTTARDVLKSILPSNVDTNKFGLYICLGRSKELLADSSRIYKAVSSVHQNKYARRLLFEIRSKKVVKRVRFADEIVVQTIVHGKCLNDNRLTSDLIETISRPSTDCSKENETHRKKHRSSLKIPKR